MMLLELFQCVFEESLSSRCSLSLRERDYLLALLAALRNFNFEKIPITLKFTCLAHHIKISSLNSLTAFHFHN